MNKYQVFMAYGVFVTYLTVCARNAAHAFEVAVVMARVDETQVYEADAVRVR